MFQKKNNIKNNIMYYSKNNGPFEDLFEFLFIFFVFVILGTIMYLMFFRVWGMEYTFESYLVFNGLFSTFGTFYVKMKSQ